MFSFSDYKVLCEDAFITYKVLHPENPELQVDLNVNFSLEIEPKNAYCIFLFTLNFKSGVSYTLTVTRNNKEIEKYIKLLKMKAFI